MASCPTTLVVLTEDKVNFPVKYAYVVVKQLFQYGVKDLSIKDDKIFLSLSYSPRAITLKKKFGNLPVRYMRVKLENHDEFKILERVIKRYKYNLLDEEEESPQIMASTSKRKLAIEEIYSSSSSSEEDEEEEEEVKEEVKKQKKGTKRLKQPGEDNPDEQQEA